MRIGHFIRGALAAALFCGGLNGVAWAQFRVDPPPPYAGGPFPTPPAQAAAMTATTLAFPSNYLSAAEAIFAAGFANPKGCVYAEISVAVGSLWSGDGGVIDTHGWLIPGTNSPRFAVCWNGLAYPVVKTSGKPADFRADIAATLEDNYRENGWVLREEDAVSHRSTHVLKGLMLLRLGEEELAYDYWASLIERDRASRPGARATKAAPARRYLPGTESVKLPEPEPAKPAAPAKPSLPPTAADPFMDWSTLWASSALDRALCAFMRGDDRLALHGVRPLMDSGAALEKSAAARGVPKPASAVRYFDFLDIAPQLFVELTRRTAPTTRPPPSIESVLARTNRAQRIEGFLARFPELAPKQRSQSGGLGPWTDDAAVTGLMEEGQAAVEPMLAFLESDAASGYTRAVGFNRDFAPGRVLHPVGAALTETLKTMLRIKPLDAVVPPKELIAAGDKANVLLAGKLRAHIQRYGIVTLEEGWYQVLTNDTANLDVWEQAIKGITSPARGGSASVGRSAERLQGESLREKTAPTVTELMQKRIGGWRMHTEQEQLGLTRHLELVRRVGLWQPGADVPLLGATAAACVEAWDTDLGLPKRKAGVAAMLGRNIARITLDRAALGDTNALPTYAAWLRRVTDEDYRQWQDNRLTRQHPLEPLWQFPTHPAAAEIASFLFDPERSGLRSSLQFSAGISSLAVLESGTALARLNAFRALLIKALEDQTVIGSVRILGNGRYEVRDNSGRIANFRRQDEDKLADPSDAQPLRYCDFVGPGMASWTGLPKMELYWTAEERDAAIALFIAALKLPDANFSRREFQGETYEVRRR